MGVFDRFKKKDETRTAAEPGKIYAPITGRYLELREIPDQVFSEGMMGNGCGIEPESSVVTAPADGVVSAVADTKHAVGITTEDGMELLIHVGMDTVKMQGKGFHVKVKMGQKVSCGTVLMEFDRELIRAAGYPATTAFVVANSDEYENLVFYTGKRYEQGEVIGKREE